MANDEINAKILNKKFKKAVFSGYDTADVDSFFDYVIDYLKNNDKMVKSYKEDAEKLKAAFEKLQNDFNALTKEKEKLLQQIKEFQEEGYGNMLLKHRTGFKK